MQAIDFAALLNVVLELLVTLFQSAYQGALVNVASLLSILIPF